MPQALDVIQGLSIIDRLLAVWIILAMVIGVLIGEVPVRVGSGWAVVLHMVALTVAVAISVSYRKSALSQAI